MLTKCWKNQFRTFCSEFNLNNYFKSDQNGVSSFLPKFSIRKQYQSKLFIWEVYDTPFKWAMLSQISLFVILNKYYHNLMSINHYAMAFLHSPKSQSYKTKIVALPAGVIHCKNFVLTLNSRLFHQILWVFQKYEGHFRRLYILKIVYLNKSFMLFLYNLSYHYAFSLSQLLVPCLISSCMGNRFFQSLPLDLNKFPNLKKKFLIS